MFNLTRYENINPQPWVTSAESRFKTLKEYKGMGFKIAVFLYEAPDSSTFRYRGYNICQSLELSTRWKGVFFYEKDLPELVDYIKDCVDLIVAIRFKWSEKLQKVIDEAHGCGIKVGFDVDDMVYDVKYTPTIMENLSIEMSDYFYNFWFAQMGRYEKTLELADFTVATNEYLGERIRDDTGKQSYVIPNYMNRLQLAASECYYRQKIEKEDSRDDTIAIGYFSGSPTHYNDFLLATPALKTVMDNYDNVILVIAGYMKMPPELEEYEKRQRVKRLDFQNFVDLQKSVAEVDINIAPLVSNDFTNCKSELKFFEAAIVGTITLASPTYTFSGAIIDGENGFLCEDGEWTEKLTYVIENGLYKDNAFAERSRTYALNRYGYYKQIDMLESMLGEMACNIAKCEE